MRFFISGCPRIGTTVTTTRFLWLPVVVVTCNGYETRWLETATVEWIYQNKWVPNRFIDKATP